jgi:hypothetical protein
MRLFLTDREGTLKLKRLNNIGVIAALATMHEASGMIRTATPHEQPEQPEQMTPEREERIARVKARAQEKREARLAKRARQTPKP